MTDPVVVIGESNPHGVDPRYALYHEPENSAGGRLCRLIFGLRTVSYHRYTTRYNLCTGAWSALPALDRARAILRAHPTGLLILLGRKVATAFGWEKAPPFCLIDRGGLVWSPTREAAPDGRWLILPHPSGRNRSWNAVGAVDRARTLLRAARPDIPWGEVDRPAVPDNVCPDCGGYREEG